MQRLGLWPLIALVLIEGSHTIASMYIIGSLTGDYVSSSELDHLYL